MTKTLQDNLSFLEKDLKHSEKWSSFCHDVKFKISPVAFGNWISPVIVSKNKDEKIILKVPNIFVKEYILSNFHSDLVKYFANDKGEIEIMFEVVNTPIPMQSESGKWYLEVSPEKQFFRNVWKKYQNASLEKSVFINPSLIEWGKEWAKKPTSIFLHGGVGCGKTYFSFALIRQAFREASIQDAAFHSCTELDSYLLDAIKGDHGDVRAISSIKKEEFLYLDDFGRETKSDRISRQFYEILNYRYANEMPTIITSNLTLDEIAKKMDAAIASRMQEWQIIHLTNEDIRKKI